MDGTIGPKKWKNLDASNKYTTEISGNKIAPK